MGKKLDAFLGRSFKAYKFKALINLALSRLAVLKNQRQARYSLARSDVVQLLNLGHHERALLRVEQVIKEQNLLDVFVMIEGYCVLLSERVNVIENEKECPVELREAISGLVFAAARCGEFPELQEMRGVFTSRYGKEFIARAVELRSNCGVNPKMIQKLSTRQPDLEVKMKVLKEIAVENGIALQLETVPSIATEEKLNKEEKNQPVQNSGASSSTTEFEETTNIEEFSNSMNKRKQYKDVADAAHEAFMSAAYAAAAARAAVELSRSSSRAPDDSNDQRKQVFNSVDEPKPGPETSQGNHSEETKTRVSRFDKVHSLDKFNINSHDEENEEYETKTKTSKIKSVGLTRKSSTMSAGVSGKDKEVVYDDSDSEAEDVKINFNTGTKLPYLSEKKNHYSFEADSGTDNQAFFSAGNMWMNTRNRPVSMRTRR